MVSERNRWMESSDVIPMFPSLLWKLQLEAGLRDALAARIPAALSEMRCGQPPLEPGRGWQSTQSLHQREDFESASVSTWCFLRSRSSWASRSG